MPRRRDVDWFKATEPPIQSLLDRLALSASVRNWDYQLRFGLFAICAADMDLIAGLMGARPTA